MTKTILVTDLNEIHHIKISCRKCGFAVILPLDSGYKKTSGCVKCDVQFPSTEIKTWIEATKALQNSIASDTASMDTIVEIEIEEASA